MNLSAQTANIDMTGPGDLPFACQSIERATSQSALRRFWLWTLFWWGGVGLCAVLFYFGVIGFVLSAKISLYGISIWLNGWLLALFSPENKNRSKMSIYHDCLVIWMLSYAVTNICWEIPWLIFSPFVFDNLHTLDDVVAYTDYMRDGLFNMYWWVLASFGSVDLRTVNHNPTFYTLELYAFANILSVIYFFYLNNKRSPYRYLIPVLSCGEPVIATFIFSFSEVFAGFENMPGGVADTLLALVWTQYQYVLFPLLFGWWGFLLLREDWRYCDMKGNKVAPSYG